MFIGGSFRSPTPRKGTETSSHRQGEEIAVSFRSPTPRKGTETAVVDTTSSILEIFPLTYSPQGD